MLTTVIICAAAITLIVKVSARPSKFPPGPRGIPILGYLPFLSRVNPFLGMVKLAERYGPVVGFYLGPFQAFISICGYEAAKATFANEDLNGRPDIRALRKRNFGKRLGLMFADGEMWKEQRRFTLREPRDLGFGKSSIEGLMQDEIRDLSSDLSAKSSQREDNVVNFNGFFDVSVINVLWTLLAGERYPRDDQKLNELLEVIEVLFRSGQPILSLFDVPPFIAKRLEKYLGLRVDLFKPLIEFIQKVVTEHKESRIKDSPRDFIDVYLEELEKRGNETDTSFTEEQLISSIMDIFGAGADTTGNSIGFALIHLIHHLEIQSKMREELQSVCGESLPGISDRFNLPYTEAVLMEAQRISNIAPFAVPRTALRDTYVQGHLIPKGALVVVNMYSVHMDPNYWGDPEAFRPERHLDASGRIVRSDHLMPFGGGKRSCIGEALARNTYFLFTAALVKNFTFEAVPGKPLPDLAPLNGFTLGYKPFSAVVRPVA